MYSDFSSDTEWLARPFPNAPTQSPWQPPEPAYTPRSFNAHSLDDAGLPWHRLAESNYLEYYGSLVHTATSSWSSNLPRQLWPQNQPSGQIKHEPVFSWASADATSDLACPQPQYRYIRQASEDESISSGRSLSPVSSERGLEYSSSSESLSPPFNGVSWKPESYLLDHHQQQQQQQTPPAFYPGLFIPAMGTTGVKMEDVQPYPDPLPEEQYDDELNHPYPVTAPETPRLPSINHIPAATAESHPALDVIEEEPTETIVVKPEDPSDFEVDDNDADYTPIRPRASTKARGPAGRNNNTTTTTTTTNNNNNNNNNRHSRKSLSGKKRHGHPNNRVMKKERKGVNVNSIVLANAKPLPNTCPHCSDAFPSKTTLNKHISTAHTRPFTCTFSLYGCSSTFGSKNEWKRHVSSQHLRLGIWRCDIGTCHPKNKRLANDAAQEAEEPVYNDFNRKDLFVQHLKRMHKPADSATRQEWDAFNASLNNTSKRCLMGLRPPPPRSVCGFCDASQASRQCAFEGDGGWEARMEHVGRHLESGHGGVRPWKEDEALRAWMVEQGLIKEVADGKWILV